MVAARGTNGGDMQVRVGDRETLVDLRRALERRPGDPVVFAHGTVRSIQPSVRDAVADVVVQDGTVVHVGAGGVAQDAVVVDCAGTTLVPAAGAAPTDATGGGPGIERLGTLAPGSPATFAVVPGSAAHGPLESVVWYADQVAAVVVEGAVTRWAGSAVEQGAGACGTPGRSVESGHLGTWTDEAADVSQALTPDGRYDERRGRRRHAYQGSFWIAGDCVVYRDDLGFWAYGRVHDDVLHHVHFRFRRA